MEKEELLAILRLQATPKVGDIIAKKLINTIGSGSKIFKESKSSLLKIDGIGDQLVFHLLDEENLKKAEDKIRLLSSI